MRLRRRSSRAGRPESLPRDLGIAAMYDLADDVHTDPAALSWLADNTAGIEVRVAIARNPNTPAAALRALARYTPWTIPAIGTLMAPICENQNTPADVLDRLSRWHGAIARDLVAASPHTRPRTLDRLGRHASAATRALVASNPRTPAYLVSSLAGDENEDVRAAVLESPRASARDVLTATLTGSAPSAVVADIVQAALSPRTLRA